MWKSGKQARRGRVSNVGLRKVRNGGEGFWNLELRSSGRERRFLNVEIRKVRNSGRW
jgi:hypothetical protein